MCARLFISHSFADGREPAARLSKALSKLPNVSLWDPTVDMRLGQPWIGQAGEQLVGSEQLLGVDAVLLVMTNGSINSYSACRTECIAAQRGGTPVIPVRMSEDVRLYPDFVLPWTIWVDLTSDFKKGIKRLEQEFMHIDSSGVKRVDVPEETWEVGEGAFGNDGRFLIGSWLVKRDPRSASKKIALIPDYELHLQPANRYREKILMPVMRRLRTWGTWFFHSGDSNLILAQDGQSGRIMTIDTHMGPNRFGGVTSGLRYRAHRMLELS